VGTGNVGYTNMNTAAIIGELGSNADLLTCSDAYLHTQYVDIATQMSKLAEELDSVMKAQRLKRMLQQRNLVATRNLSRDNDGQVNDIVIAIKPLPDALQSLEKERVDDVAIANEVAQHIGWANDGYDLDTSAALR